MFVEVEMDWKLKNGVKVHVTASGDIEESPLSPRFDEASGLCMSFATDESSDYYETLKLLFFDEYQMSQAAILKMSEKVRELRREAVSA